MARRRTIAQPGVSRPRVRSLRPSSWRLTCPLVLASSSSSPAGPIWPRQRPFEPGHKGPYPAGYPRRPVGGLALLSGFPVAFRPPAFARPSCSRRGVPPSSRSAYRPQNDMAGPRRDYRVPHARAMTGLGALSTPGTVVLIRAGGDHRPAPAASQRHVPSPALQHPTWRGSHNEASTRVQAIHRVGRAHWCAPPPPEPD